MKPLFGLAAAGLLMLFAPGCCVLAHVFGCGWHDHDVCCGPGQCEHGDRHLKKCAKKCRKCRECLEEHGYGYGDMFAYGGMIPGDMGLVGDCGCGGGMMADIGAGCGCGMPGGCASCGQAGPTSYPVPMSAPTMAPSSEAAPAPTSGIKLNYPQAIPAIPPMENSSLPQPPQGVQQVSVEEFQRLPGVVISGPTTSPDPSSQLATSSAVPATIDQPLVAKPVQPSSAKTSVPSNARQVQQTGWAPVQK
jgi:hypothetical protein